MTFRNIVLGFLIVSWLAPPGEAWIFEGIFRSVEKKEADMDSGTALKIGQAAPGFKNLLGTDGKRYALNDFSSSKVLVVVFSCNHCPYVQAYEGRLIALQKDFKDKGVQFVAINSNDDATMPEDDYDHMVKRARERNFNFLYLRDETQDVARAYGATHTPQIFVFNQKRELAYTGKIDDNWQQPTQVKTPYLRDALLALLQGKAPAEAQTHAIGCTIKWKR